MEPIKMKITQSEMKISLDQFNSRINTAEENFE